MNTAFTVIAAGTPVPSCGKADLGRSIYVTDEHIFKYCSDQGWANLNPPKGDKGDRGDKGDKGDKGDTGGTGSTGANGANGSAYSVYTSADVRLGALLTATDTAMLVGVGSSAADYGVMAIDQASGAFQDGKCQITSSFLQTCTCHYTTAACSGTCFLPYKPIKHSLYRNATQGYLRATGLESVSSSTPLYAFSNSSCVFSPLSPSTYYVVSSSYTFPSGFPSLPINDTPLYIDP